MTHCLRCNKFMLLMTSSGYCKNCEIIVKEENYRKAKEERKRKEEEARRRVEEERKRLEEEIRRIVEEERKRKEEEARRIAEEERKRKEEASWRAEEERKRLEEVCRKVEEEKELLQKYYSNEIDQTNIIKAIRNQRISVNCIYKSNGNSLRLLSMAISKKDCELIDCLIENGCDVNLKSHLINQLGDMYVTPLENAVEKKNLTILNKLLDAGADVHKKTRFSGGFKGEGVMSVLSLAASCCKVEILKRLMECGADPNDVDYDNSGTSFPLSYAFFAHKYDNANLLIESGANVNYRLRCPNADFALLSWTIMNDDTEGFDILMNANADPNCIRISHEGWGDNPAVCDAVSEGRHDMVRRLLQAGAKKDSVVIHNGRRYTLRQLAQANNDTKMLSILDSFGI